MRASLLVFAAVGAALVAASCGSAGGVKYTTYSGPASAKLKIGGMTYHFKGGRCSRKGRWFSIKIGTETIPQNRSKYRFFTLRVRLKAKNNHQQLVDWQFPDGKWFAIQAATVKLAGGPTRGTFSGLVVFGSNYGISKPPRATGSFSCG